MKFASVYQASQMDKSASEDYSISQNILMENAAVASCSVIKDRFSIEGNNFLILCGTGNNGGDGFALARLIYSEGGAPLVFLNGSEENLKNCALENFNILKNLPIEIIHNNMDHLKKELIETDFIIDALLGTGLNRNIKGNLENILNIVNSSEKPVISLDIPTGINGDNGQIMGTALSAQYTITFGSPKIGNLLYPGYKNGGTLYLSRISLPPEVYEPDFIDMEINLCSPLPERDPAGHKKTFGDILTIAGAKTYYGAPRFAALAVLKSGAGYSRLAAPASMVPILSPSIPEVIFHSLKETPEGSISKSNLEILLSKGAMSDGTIIGPGLSLNAETLELVRDYVNSYTKFLIIDGDGISAVANNQELISKRSLPAILTPHKGEMSRLSGYSLSEIDKDPINILKNCSKIYNAIIVLKGAHSLIGFPDGKIFLNTTGNSGMGTAGSGDILAGVIAGFYGLGLNIKDAVKNGVFVHGAAGDSASEKLGKDGITASDILNELPLTVKRYRENYEGFIEIKNNYIKKI